MNGRIKRPARTRVKKIDLLARSRMLDNAPQRNSKEEDVNIAQQNAAFKIPKRLPIGPADSLHLCVLKLMSDGDEYSVDDLVSLASKITPNTDAIPKIIMGLFHSRFLDDRKELEEGSTVYYYTLNEQGKQHMNNLMNGAKDQERVVADPTTEQLDEAIWTVMLDYKKRTAEELINTVTAQSGLPRGLIDQRFHNIFRRVEIVRAGKGKSTTYSLRKGETIEKLMRKNLPTVGTVKPETLAGLGEKFNLKIATPKKEDPAVTATKYRTLSPDERTIKKDDTLVAMIWRAMYGNGFLSIVEVALILKDHGKSETSVRNAFNDLIEKDWFFIELRGKRKIRHFCIKGNIDPTKVEDDKQLPIAPVVEEVKDDRPLIWVADLASNIGIDLASVVRMLPDYGLKNVATQMITAAVADKIRADIDPKNLLAGMSMNDLAKEMDVPLSTLIEVQNKLNPGSSLTVGSVERLRESEELEHARGTAMLSVLASEINVMPARLIGWLERNSIQKFEPSSIIPAAYVSQIREMAKEQSNACASFSIGEDESVHIADLAQKLKVTTAKVVKWMKLRRHQIDTENKVSAAAAKELLVNPEGINEVEGAIVVGDLALEIGVTPAAVIKALAARGIVVTISQVLASETADQVRNVLVSKVTIAELARELNQSVEEVVTAHCDVNNRGRTSIRENDILNHHELSNLRQYFSKQKASLAPHASVQSLSIVPTLTVSKPVTVVEEVRQNWGGEMEPKRRSFLKVKIHLFGMDLIPEDAKALATKLKVMGMATEEGRQALTSNSLLNITFKIGDEVLSIKELHDLYQELEEAGFCDE